MVSYRTVHVRTSLLTSVCGWMDGGMDLWLRVRLRLSLLLVCIYVSIYACMSACLYSSFWRWAFDKLLLLCCVLIGCVRLDGRYAVGWYMYKAPFLVGAFAFSKRALRASCGWLVCNSGGSRAADCHPKPPVLLILTEMNSLHPV